MATIDCGDLSFMFDRAPLANKTIGTFPQGTVQFSLGYQNTADDVAAIIAALREI